MTRINVVPVEQLTRPHLLAEYREITRLPNNLRKSLSRKGKPFSTNEIPPKYTLGTGHVKFFYNKFGYLKQRFEQLVTEMIRRGYSPKFTDSSIFDGFESVFNGDYTPTDEAVKINQDRINERLRGILT
jgi:deoxyribonuclease (pyrimidine dimer)